MRKDDFFNIFSISREYSGFCVKQIRKLMTSSPCKNQRSLRRHYGSTFTHLRHPSEGMSVVFYLDNECRFDFTALSSLV